ncbi:MAG TPA: hypothetical protein VGM43_23195 [Bryobacteraceae bacterium]|jgi:hypothetical protein
MAFTQTQLDALESAIATGALSCEFDGKRATYRSLDEMMRIRDTMRVSLGLNSTTKRYSLTSYTRDSSAPCATQDLIDPFGQNNA